MTAGRFSTKSELRFRLSPTFLSNACDEDPLRLDGGMGHRPSSAGGNRRPHRAPNLATNLTATAATAFKSGISATIDQAVKFGPRRSLNKRAAPQTV